LTILLHLNRDWSPRFSTLRDKNGWVRAKTARNLNIGVSRNRFGDFLADPESRSFSRFGAIIMQFAVGLCWETIALHNMQAQKRGSLFSIRRTRLVRS
jgi:hypothetical protein